MWTKAELVKELKEADIMLTVIRHRLLYLKEEARKVSPKSPMLFWAELLNEAGIDSVGSCLPGEL